MIARIKAGWQLTGKSWQTLQSDKTLLLFPLLSGLSTIVLFLLLLLPTGALIALLGEEALNNDLLFYFGLFLFLLASIFATAFFNVALVSQVMRLFQGEETGVGAGISLAWSKRGVIFRWALLAALVGTVLRFLQDRLPLGGAILAALGGLVWSVASWFVVPILAIENKGPLDALKSSVDTVKKRWGQGAVGVVVIGGIFSLLALLSIVLAFAGAILLWQINLALAITWGLILFAILILLLLISSALRQIFDAAVYLSLSTDLEQIGPFDRGDIEAAVIKKKGD